MSLIERPARIDAYRYSWEAWHEDGAHIVGLLDHTGNDSRSMLIADSSRDASILLTVLRSLDIKTPGGLPFNPSTIQS